MIASFLLTGIVLLVIQGVNAATWIDSATKNVNLVTLFIFAPLFGIPIRFPEYIQGLREFYKLKIKRNVPFFLGTTLLTHLIGIVMNIGSVSVVYQIASVNQRLSSKRLLSNALNRGFSFSIMWSPYFAAMVLVTSALDVTWTAMFPYIIGYTGICFLISFLMEWSYLRQTDPSRSVKNAEKADASETKYRIPLLQLTFYLLGAVALIMLLDHVLEWSIIMTICLTGTLYPLLWCVINRHFAVYREGFWRHVNSSIPTLKREVILFISAGFLSGAVALTSFDQWLYYALDATPLPLPLAFTVLVLLAFFVTALIGLHPIVLAAILVTGIDPQMMGISDMYYGVLVLGGWVSTNIMSPSTAVSNLTAHLLKMNVLEVVRNSYKLAAILVIVLPIYLFMVL